MLTLRPDFKISREESPRIREAFERAQDPFDWTLDDPTLASIDQHDSPPSVEASPAIPVWAIGAGGIAIIGGLVGVILWRQSTGDDNSPDVTATWQLP